MKLFLIFEVIMKIFILRIGNLERLWSKYESVISKGKIKDGLVFVLNFGFFVYYIWYYFCYFIL